MNSARRRALAAAATLLLLTACAAGRNETPKGDVYTDDAALTARVKSAIATNVGARAAGAVSVEAYRGTVQLSGFVDSKDVAERATKAASKVSGVKSLKNDLRVKSPS